MSFAYVTSAMFSYGTDPQAGLNGNDESRCRVTELAADGKSRRHRNGRQRRSRWRSRRLRHGWRQDTARGEIRGLINHAVRHVLTTGISDLSGIAVSRRTPARFRRRREPRSCRARRRPRRRGTRRPLRTVGQPMRTAPRPAGPAPSKLPQHQSTKRSARFRHHLNDPTVSSAQYYCAGRRSARRAGLVTRSPRLGLTDRFSW